LGSEKTHNYQFSDHKVYKISAKPKSPIKELSNAPSIDSHTEFLCTRNFCEDSSDLNKKHKITPKNNFHKILDTVGEEMLGKVYLEEMCRLIED
jgi:hypothetical protein